MDSYKAEKLKGFDNQDLADKFLSLANQIESLKSDMDAKYQALNAVMNEMGLDAMVQDDEGTVYKVVTPKGTYVPYHPIGYVRTRRDEEKSGTLSLGDATAAGFEVEKRKKG